MPELHRPSVIVWGSGSGTTFRAIAEAIRDGMVGYDIPLVITDKENAGILGQVDEVNKWQQGRDSQIETMVINRQRFPGGPQQRGQTLAEAEETCRVMQKYGDSVLLLAGCLRILGEPVLQEFGWHPEWEDPDSKYRSRIINTHPGILPATADTFGVGASQKVLQLRLSQTAHTLCAVGGAVDGGPIISQHLIDIPHYPGRIPIADAAERLFTQIVQPVEKANLPYDVARFLLFRRVILE